MKNKFVYILPIATIASVATITTPLITSCSIEDGGFSDDDDPYIPDIPQAEGDQEHETTGYQDSEAEQMFFNDLKNNPNLFKEEMFYQITNDFFDYLKNYAPEQYKDDVTIKANLDYKNIQVDENAKTIAFKITGSLYSDVGSFCEQDEMSDNGTIVSKSFIDLHNINIDCKFQYSLANYYESQIQDEYIWTLSIEEELIFKGSMKGTFAPFNDVESKLYDPFVYSGETLDFTSQDQKCRIGATVITYLCSSDCVYHMLHIKTAE